MALHRESFYHMNFSQQESGQSTLCEHLIGLTAGEKGENAGGTGGGQEKEETKEETKTGEKCESLRILTGDIFHAALVINPL